MVKKIGLLLGVAMVIGAASVHAGNTPSGYFVSSWDDLAKPFENELKNLFITSPSTPYYKDRVKQLKEKFEIAIYDVNERRQFVQKNDNEFLKNAMKVKHFTIVNALLDLGADPRVLFSFDYDAETNKRILYVFMHKCSFIQKLDELFGAECTDVALLGLLVQVFPGKKQSTDKFKSQIKKIRESFDKQEDAGKPEIKQQATTVVPEVVEGSADVENITTKIVSIPGPLAPISEKN